MPSPNRLPDPGAMPEPAALHVTEVTRTYPCTACGAQLVFDPASQQLRCPSCGNTVAIQGRPYRGLAKHDLGSTMRGLAALRAQAPATLEKEIVCQACGGHTTFTGSLTAVRCPYCNTPIQRDDLKDAPARLAVDGLLPFRVDEKTARAQIEQWINSRWFAPNEFKKYRELGSFSSIYLAYYGYDADTTTSYSGQRGEHYYVTVGSGDNERREQRTNWYSTSGVVSNQFVDVSGLANTGLDTEKVQALEPWPLETAAPYQQEYIAGHLSRTYDAEPDEVFGRLVQPQMESTIEATIRSDIGGDEQRITSKSVTWTMLQFSHVLLPVWLLTVTYQQKPFQVFINGVTGEVQGNRPYSAIKIALAVIAGIIVAAILFWIFGR
jgi:DNA-directed RNA polymerase subunit RPC12/RpoP